VNAVDTSVAIPAFASWHRAHTSALEIVNAGVVLPAHAAFETYSVLTRMPDPHRANPSSVLRFLTESFDEHWPTMTATSMRRLLSELAGHGIRGGSTYDGLIGATARSVGAKLFTRDRRAKPIYDLLGVEVEFVG
jgi:predicted nucleic acid-binding protein